VRRAASAALMVAALAAWGAAPSPKAPRPIALDLEVERDPVADGRTLRLFGRQERNQRMDLDHDTAPDCSPVPIATAVPPVACAGAVFALDRSGALWRLAAGFPKTVDQLPGGVLTLLPGEPLPAVLYADRLRLPDGAFVPLPFAATAAWTAGSGWWVCGAKGAVLLRADGTVAWSWNPKGLHPSAACATGRLLCAATQEGWLVALDASSGRERWRYRTGGELAQPVAAPQEGVVLASADHALRRLDRKGRLRWQVRLSSRLAWPARPYGAGWLAAEQGGRHVVLVDETTGKTVWTWAAPAGEILFPPAVAGDEACVLVSTGEAAPTLWLVPLPPALPGGEARG